MQIDLLQANARAASALPKSLANPDRLLLLCQLVGGERTVTELENLTAIHQPTLSQQLGILREENLVTTRRAGKQIFYRVSNDDALQVLQTLYRLYCPVPKQL